MGKHIGLIGIEGFFKEKDRIQSKGMSPYDCRIASN